MDSDDDVEGIDAEDAGSSAHATVQGEGDFMLLEVCSGKSGIASEEREWQLDSQGLTVEPPVAAGILASRLRVAAVGQFLAPALPSRCCSCGQPRVAGQQRHEEDAWQDHDSAQQ